MNEKGFRLACRNGYIEILKYLIDVAGIKNNNTNKNGINIYVKNEKAFRKACANGHIEIVKKRSFFGHKLCL